MKNHDEYTFQNKFPKMKLNDEAKDRIHTSILHHVTPTRQKRSWKEGKFIGVVTTVMGLILFSVLTAYILFETEKGKTEQLLADAGEKVDAVYGEMEKHLETAGPKALLKEVNPKALKAAEASMGEINADSSISNEEKAKKLNKKLITLQEYNQMVPFVNDLQKNITLLNKEIYEGKFQEGVQEEIARLKNELDIANKKFDSLESANLKSFFSERYSPQLAAIEESINQLQDMSSQIEELSTIAKEQSMNKDEFDKQIEGVLQQLDRLPNEQTAIEMENRLKQAQTEYNEIQQKKQEEIRQEEIKKEEERKEAENNKAADSPKEDQDGEYPMEFTETTPQGITIKYSRDFKGNETLLHYDELAKKYGGRYYFIPNSDGGVIFKNGQQIAGVSISTSALLEYKDLFIELCTYNSKNTKAEFSEIVNTVIQTGEPYKVGNDQGGSELRLKNGVLLYDSW
ncbi:hypothetical protein KYJ26_06240 [Bacillus sp. MCCB 382]|uniref:hypothetical protein n=1 Tax=Bacillus sp. MCCB 382 TaxID=2860197 RepID=UPI001C59ABE4|nr:hypothetical protein [Bacillus sp. MCCB 382]